MFYPPQYEPTQRLIFVPLIFYRQNKASCTNRYAAFCLAATRQEARLWRRSAYKYLSATAHYISRELKFCLLQVSDVHLALPWQRASRHTTGAINVSVTFVEQPDSEKIRIGLLIYAYSL